VWTQILSDAGQNQPTLVLQIANYDKLLGIYTLVEVYMKLVILIGIIRAWFLGSYKGFYIRAVKKLKEDRH
jgi:hypothetical protein